MKRRIMLDMDGVLCDFEQQADLQHARKENGKCDWKLMDKIGPKFWSEMKWIEEGRKLYNALLELVKKNPDIELGIASAIFLRNGKKGKKEWLAANCPEIDKANIIITNKGLDKWLELDEGDILIDDKKENIECLDGTIPDACGILFISAEDAMGQLKKILENS